MNGLLRRYVRLWRTWAKIGVLVLDDFLLTPPSVIEAKDLLEVIDDRSQLRRRRPTESTTGGAGLGLSIAAELIGLMRGPVPIESTVNRGTTVTVLLPLAGRA